MIAVNKADGDNLARAKAAAAEYRAALHILSPRSPNWSPPVVTYSALTGDGIAALWDARSRASRTAHRIGRACGAPRRAAGEMDVGDARRASVRAVAVRSGAQGGPAADRGRCRGGASGAQRGGRGNCRHARALTHARPLAGFGPFPGAPFNPSAVLVKALARRRRPALAGIVCTTHVFATTYAAVDRDLPKLFATEAGCHSDVWPRRAPTSALHRDAGAQCGLGLVSRCQRISPSARRHCAVANRSAAAALRRSPTCWARCAAIGFPARLSRDAGRYLCNYAYWRALERARGGRPLVQFVHIPPVRLNPRRAAANGHRGSSFPPLVAAAEALLIALMAASRR